MPKSVPIISPPTVYHNLSAGELADEHGQLGVDIAALDARKKAIAAEIIRRGVPSADGAFFSATIIAESMVSSLDRSAIERAMGEAWLDRFLKWSKRSAHVRTTARTAVAARLAA